MVWACSAYVLRTLTCSVMYIQLYSIARSYVCASSFEWRHQIDIEYVIDKDGLLLARAALSSLAVPSVD